MLIFADIKTNKMNKIQINPDKIYTKHEYSKTFCISRPTIDKYVKSNKLKSLRVNGVTLIIRD